MNIVSESSKDLFGIRTLDFRFDVSNGEEPDFLTADITDYIECRPFLASEYDEKPYMPGQRYDDKLDDYCFATPGIYLIPLYLLVGSGSKDDKLRKKRLLAIIKRMRDQITESISTYHFNLDVEAKQEFAFSIIIDSLDRKKYSDASDKDEKFESLIIEKAELWEDYFQKYLYSCIEKMKLNKIEMPEGSRARAIDIYENMNMGGLSLSTLDLVAARVATGKYQEYDKDFIFATIQTLSKEENLHRYEKNAFDAIVIDEAHHSAANSYKKVLDYFEPKLWLGMTATPDKRDDNLEGRNIYEIFNHQIAYEIRLQDAMEEDLLCPFHYFGITDLDIIADAGKSSGEKVENFRYLISEERVENVMKQAEYFGYSGDRVKGLIFCSRIDEAKELSKKFNDKGWRTLVLSGSDSEEARAAAIERLAGEESEDALDYIISVDIFSEGVDVPEINQVIMLRPTESPIVFIQQLGRGLRKAENKEYVVVLDFIGNYRNNFMIPIALSGDRSYNKDNIRRYVTEGGRVIPGASTIHFDEISRKRIFQAIDNANFSDIKLIRENYTNLKNKLGHIPALADFDKYGEMDVLRIFDNNSLGSYYKFLVKYEKEYTIRLSEDEEKAIEFISKKLASGKRIHELELLKRTLQYHHGIIGRLRKHLSEKYQCEMDEHCTENVVNMMTNEFSMSAAKKTYAQCVFLKKEQDDYGISDVYGKMLQNPEFCAILEELVDFGISRYKVNYSYHYQDTNLVLYQKYTYEDACRLLNWERNEVPLNIGGYKYDKKTKTFPIFINYDKQDNISDTTKYEDHFVAENRLIAISKSGRSMDSEDVQNFLKATERGIDVQLFVRKNKDDKISKEFYYLGRVIATGNAKQFVIPNTDKTAVEIEWELETPVREDIYQYIVNE